MLLLLLFTFRGKFRCEICGRARARRVGPGAFLARGTVRLFIFDDSFSCCVAKTWQKKYNLDVVLCDVNWALRVSACRNSTGVRQGMGAGVSQLHNAAGRF